MSIFSRAFSRAFDAFDDSIDLMRTLEKITRPPKLGHDVDVAHAEALRRNENFDNGPSYKFGRDIKVGEAYCALCGDLLGEDFHRCPLLRRHTDPQPQSAPAPTPAGSSPAAVSEDPPPPAAGLLPAADRIRDILRGSGMTFDHSSSKFSK